MSLHCHETSYDARNDTRWLRAKIRHQRSHGARMQRDGRQDRHGERHTGRPTGRHSIELEGMETHIIPHWDFPQKGQKKRKKNVLPFTKTKETFLPTSLLIIRAILKHNIVGSQG